MKKILIILSGGRAYGNTAQLVKSFCGGAKSAGHVVETISLLQNEVKGCLGCNACRYGKPPIISGGHSPNGSLPPATPAKGRVQLHRTKYKGKRLHRVCFSAIFLDALLTDWGSGAVPTSKSKAFIERFYCIAIPDDNPPLGRYEKYPIKDCALLMTSADNFFWTFKQAASYYQFAIVNYIGFRDKGMLLAGGCGDTNGKPQIDKTDWLDKAYAFGREIYGADDSVK